MAFKAAIFQSLSVVLARRVLIRIVMLISALAIFPSMHFVAHIDPMELFVTNSGDCDYSHFFPGRYLKPLTFYALPLLKGLSRRPSPCQADTNFTSGVFRELMGLKLLNAGDKALFVGEGSGPAVLVLQNLGFYDALKISQPPFSSLMRKSLVGKISFEDNSFDFVFSNGLDRAPVPTLLVLEIERVLKPGGVGAMLVEIASSKPGDLIKAVTPISSFLKRSDIVHVGIHATFTLVVFKKMSEGFCSFEHYRLPEECPSIANNKPFIEYLEPLLDGKLIDPKDRFAYLTKFMDISDRNRLTYIDIGAGEFVESSIAKWFIPLYPTQSRAFHIYAMDHNSSVLLSYAGRHGVTFVYYPALTKQWVAVDSHMHEELDSLYDDNDGEPELFDFLGWIKETTTKGDFLVLKMNAGGSGFKLLHELFESGAICLVDELFLHCENNAEVQDATGGDCSQLFKALRGRGVFVHQW